MRTMSLSMILLASVALAGCGSTTGSRVSSGAAIGAGTGALGGVLVDQHKKGNFD